MAPKRRSGAKAKRQEKQTREEPRRQFNVNCTDEESYNESYIDFYLQGYADIIQKIDSSKLYSAYDLKFYSETYRLEIYQKQNKFYQLKTIPTTQFEEIPPMMIETVKNIEKMKAAAKSEKDLDTPEYSAAIACLHQYAAGNFYQSVLFYRNERGNDSTLFNNYLMDQEQIIKVASCQKEQYIPVDPIVDDNYKPVSADNSKLTNKIKEIEAQLITQRKEFETQLKNKTKEYESQLSSQKNDYESKLSSQKNDYESKLSSQKNDYESQISTQKNTYETQLATQKQELDDLRHKQDEHIQEFKKLQEENEKLQETIRRQTEKDKKIEFFGEDEINNLETIEEIGYGGSGKVYKVFKKIVYALKVMNAFNATHENLKKFMFEYEIMNMLRHPNILKTFGIFMGDEKRPPSFLLEFCPTNIDAAIRSNQLSDVQIVTSIYQIAEGMRYVHYQKVIHRDLKPSNILIADDGTIKIADFGISKLMTSEEMSMTQGIGTQKFMAPELINEEEYYDEKVDVYSFGVLMFFILNAGKMPKITITQVGTGKKAEIPPNFTDFAKNIINSCWNFEPNDRPSFPMICEQLSKNVDKIMKLTDSELKAVNDFLNDYRKDIPIYS